MNKKFFAALMVGAVLATGMPSASADSSVEAVGEKTFLYLDTREAPLADGVRAVDQKNGMLYIFDADGDVLLRLRNTENALGGVGFAVREIRVEGERSRFWEVLADVGAHAQNCGYWLIGRQDGEWKILLSTKDLAAVGYRAEEWHLLSSKIENGQYILESAIEYMPEGAQFGYERKILVDWNAELVWSEKTRSFLLRPLPLG